MKQSLRQFQIRSSQSKEIIMTIMRPICKRMTMETNHIMRMKDTTRIRFRNSMCEATENSLKTIQNSQSHQTVHNREKQRIQAQNRIGILRQIRRIITPDKIKQGIAESMITMRRTTRQILSMWIMMTGIPRKPRHCRNLLPATEKWLQWFLLKMIRR